VKPGWVRMNFNYFISEAAFDFLLEAVEIVANEGWKAIPHYHFCPFSGQWRHRGGRPEPVMRLHAITYKNAKLEYRSRHATEPEDVLSSYLDEARRILKEAEGESPRVGGAAEPVLSEHFERLRWFPLPSEIVSELAGRVPVSRAGLSIPGM
jgi:hypothetical protein